MRRVSRTAALALGSLCRGGESLMQETGMSEPLASRESRLRAGSGIAFEKLCSERSCAKSAWSCRHHRSTEQGIVRTIVAYHQSYAILGVYRNSRAPGTRDESQVKLSLTLCIRVSRAHIFRTNCVTDGFCFALRQLYNSVKLNSFHWQGPINTIYISMSVASIGHVVYMGEAEYFT